MSSGIEIIYSSDPEVQQLRGEVDARMRQVATELTKWTQNTRAVTNRSSLFDRTAYAAPDNVFSQMRIARQAVRDDDVVAGVAETTEGMAFDGVKWESENADEADVFNQMATAQNLDAVIRRMYREEFTYSQCVHAMWWDWEEFTVRGATKNGNKRKKTYRVWFPRTITTLDSTKVVPVGMLTFGQERLAWHASVFEMEQFQRYLNGELIDPMMSRFYEGVYQAYDMEELTELTSLEVDPQRLILLNPDMVKRHTMTRPDHERFADLRMRSIFKLLDLKQQLMEADRVALIGAANYILLVKKGSKEDPAYPEEIQNLRDGFEIIAKLPVIFSDHRLEIEIITPKQDYTLQIEKYDVLDNRMLSRLLGMLSASGSRSGQRTDDTLKVGRIVARGLENRRRLFRRYFEREIARAVVNHPKNAGVFEGEPNLTFVPRKIQLDDDTGTAQQIVALRTMREVSRDSLLEYFGFDQAVEAMRMAFEKETYDDIFESQVPFSSPNGAAPAQQGPAGAQGGRPDGGGQQSKNPTKSGSGSAAGTTRPKKGT